MGWDPQQAPTVPLKIQQMRLFFCNLGNDNIGMGGWDRQTNAHSVLVASLPSSAATELSRSTTSTTLKSGFKDIVFIVHASFSRTSSRVVSSAMRWRWKENYLFWQHKIQTCFVMADLVIEYGRQQVPEWEVWPKDRSKVDDGIFRLPQKEIRKSFLPRGSDHQVDRGRRRSVEHCLQPFHSDLRCWFQYSISWPTA